MVIMNCPRLKNKLSIIIETFSITSSSQSHSNHWHVFWVHMQLFFGSDYSSFPEDISYSITLDSPCNSLFKSSGISINVLIFGLCMFVKFISLGPKLIYYGTGESSDIVDRYYFACRNPVSSSLVVTILLLTGG